jgi:type I restriction enzyme R subunit
MRSLAFMPSKPLKNYTDSKGKGEPTLRAEEAFSVLLGKMDVVRGLFHGFDYSKFENNAYKLLVPAANHILGLDDGKKRFLDAVLAINKAYSLCSTLNEAKELRAEIAT